MPSPKKYRHKSIWLEGYDYY